jgi:hypothetical protein
MPPSHPPCVIDFLGDPSPSVNSDDPYKNNFQPSRIVFLSVHGYRRKGALGMSDLPLSLFLPCRLNDNRCSLVFGARHHQRSRMNGVGNELMDPGPYSKWLSLAKHDEPLTVNYTELSSYIRHTYSTSTSRTNSEVSSHGCTLAGGLGTQRRMKKRWSGQATSE